MIKLASERTPGWRWVIYRPVLLEGNLGHGQCLTALSDGGDGEKTLSRGEGKYLIGNVALPASDRTGNTLNP